MSEIQDGENLQLKKDAPQKDNMPYRNSKNNKFGTHCDRWKNIVKKSKSWTEIGNSKIGLKIWKVTDFGIVRSTRRQNLKNLKNSDGKLPNLSLLDDRILTPVTVNQQKTRNYDKNSDLEKNVARNFDQNLMEGPKTPTTAKVPDLDQKQEPQQEQSYPEVICRKSGEDAKVIGDSQGDTEMSRKRSVQYRRPGKCISLSSTLDLKLSAKKCTPKKKEKKKLLNVKNIINCFERVSKNAGNLGDLQLSTGWKTTDASQKFFNLQSTNPNSQARPVRQHETEMQTNNIEVSAILGDWEYF